jgi:diguanylate cyclase (GGDEF)-like protein/PAS domain S-box-containing protein
MPGYLSALLPPLRDFLARRGGGLPGGSLPVPEGPSASREAHAFVWSTILAGGAVFASSFPHDVPNVGLFLALTAASSIASALRLRLPLGTSASSLSVSYTVDFAALLLIGRDLTMVVAAASAFTQSTIGVDRRNPPVRILFNVMALIVTVYAAGTTFLFFGGGAAAPQIGAIAKPLVASALVYYLVNTALVATAIGLSSGQPPLRVWDTHFVWTAPSYFVGAGAAVAGVALWQTGHGWLVPLATAPVYLTFRSYSIYVERIAAEKRHNDEVLQLHKDAMQALEAAQRSEQRYALAAAGSNDGLWDWEIPADALYCSARWKLMLGLSPAATITTLDAWLQYVHDDDRPGLRAAIDSHLAGYSAHFEHEYRIAHAGGGLRWVLCRGIAVRDEDGQPVRMAGSQTDVTESRRSQDTLARAARHDHLTALPNRRLFGELLQRSIARSVRSVEARYAVLFIDLDGFKLVNDSLGHLVGDQFLVAIATRLQAQLRPGDVLARLGGDEFAVLVEDFATQEDVCVITQRLQHSLQEPLRLDSRELYASASIGVVLGGPQYGTVDELLRDADIAMYRAKAAGRGGYELFDPAMRASAIERLTLETELRQAVERREFNVFYQPIVELATTEVVGLEALVRWVRPDGRIARPAEFIPVAEETGLVVPMTYLVLREACREAAAWQAQFDRPLGISVNISSKLFAREDFVDQVAQALAACSLRPGTLRLEVTESALLNHSEVVHRNFERLRKMSVAMYLDDFGTGYSSLSYLQRYPVDALKLDRSFVVRLGTDDNPAIGHAIVKLARELGMGLIAEGVETAAHAEQLKALDCPHAQGNLFSEPLTRESTEALLTKAYRPQAKPGAVHNLRSFTRRTA